jgi:uncharacterized protein
MRTVLIAIILTTGMIAWAAQDITITVPGDIRPDKTPTLDVTGSAEIKTSPDLVIVNATIYSRNNKAGRAFDDNQTRMSNAMNKLEAMGLPHDKITTTSLAISPVYRNDNSGKIDYFTVTRNLSIIQEDLSNISPILDALVDSGVEDIGSISFVVKDMEGKRKEAMEKAAKDCAGKAETLASAMGARITGLRAIRYDMGGYGNYDRGISLGQAEMSQMNQMIVPAAVSTQVNVYATYTIEYIGR